MTKEDASAMRARLDQYDALRTANDALVAARQLLRTSDFRMTIAITESGVNLSDGLGQEYTCLTSAIRAVHAARDGATSSSALASRKELRRELIELLDSLLGDYECVASNGMKNA